MKKRVVSLLMATAISASLLAACGGSSAGSSAATGETGGDAAAAGGAEGAVINIYSWNDEFRTRLEAVYPEVESTSTTAPSPS